tara:strand:- start:5071 stop:5322 length:252 start_codon:yes stop_codon:yes gene_type:complete
LLIDYIDPQYLPFFILWLDWCFYAYNHEFGILIALCVWRCSSYREKTNDHAIKHLPKGMALSFILGFIAWVAYCLYWQGTGIG